MEECGIPAKDLLFQQDNDPKNTSKEAKMWGQHYDKATTRDDPRD